MDSAKHHDGWTPSDMTATGKPMVDETTLEATMVTASAMHVPGPIWTTNQDTGDDQSEGVNAWLKLVTSASRHTPPLFSRGSHLSGCAHRNPNLSPGTF